MNTKPTKTFVHELTEKHLLVPMSGNDYDTCTELLRRLLNSGAIHAYLYDDTTSSAIVYHFAKVEEEEPPNDDNEAKDVEDSM
jgi:hypothetical protein